MLARGEGCNRLKSMTAENPSEASAEQIIKFPT
jgi:hypothetical protein